MKRIINLNIAGAVLAFTLLLSFSACKKDASHNDGLTGTWLASIPQTQETSQYVFKSDHTYEHTSSGVDTITKKSLGIRAKETGKYQIKDQTLNLYAIVSYLNKDNKYGPATDLVSVAGRETANYTMTMEDKDNKLTLAYICGPAELCALDFVRFYFYRQ